MGKLMVGLAVVLLCATNAQSADPYHKSVNMHLMDKANSLERRVHILEKNVVMLLNVVMDMQNVLYDPNTGLEAVQTQIDDIEDWLED